ncbi:MAG TPA: hypothetical protein VJ484_02785, partial [Lysobacter sp.]|nr:hypothetical protein [Lysobacter sp.]
SRDRSPGSSSGKHAQAIEQAVPNLRRPRFLLDLQAFVGKLLEKHEGDVLRRWIRARSEALRKPET